MPEVAEWQHALQHSEPTIRSSAPLRNGGFTSIVGLQSWHWDIGNTYNVALIDMARYWTEYLHWEGSWIWKGMIEADQ